MDTVVRWVVRDPDKRSVTLCESREQAQWFCFMLGHGYHFGIITDRLLLRFLNSQEGKPNGHDEPRTDTDSPEA